MMGQKYLAIEFKLMDVNYKKKNLNKIDNQVSTYLHQYLYKRQSKKTSVAFNNEKSKIKWRQKLT